MFVKTEERPQGEIQQAPAKVLDEPARLLLKAADLIEERGHAKGVLENSCGNLCARGAILSARFGRALFHRWEHPGWDGEWNMADIRVQEAVGMDTAIWNNASERTQAEVVAKLREVALS